VTRDETAAGAPTELPLVVVTVGTDHHPFERLLGWVDEWLTGGAEDRVVCVVQHGTGRPPRGARCVHYLEHDEFSDLVGRAAAVVSHGGPATIAECRKLGRVPLVVPRRAEFGEHVDDHQVLFADRLASRGHVVLVDDREQLVEQLEAAVANPSSFAVPTDLMRPLEASVRRFGELVAELRPSDR
jgi:UDP-N-acetylglucosamine transferase subunit ALG13